MRHTPFHHDHWSITHRAGHTIRDVRRLHHTFVSFPSERKGETGGLLLWTAHVWTHVHTYPCLTLGKAKAKGTVVRCGPEKRGLVGQWRHQKGSTTPFSLCFQSHARSVFSPRHLRAAGVGQDASYPDPCSNAQVCAPTAQPPPPALSRQSKLKSHFSLPLGCGEGKGHK